jgi:acetoin utilization deacetylase AcuC-like enzyme
LSVFRTGVFFHSEFAGKDWPIIGERFSGFPAAMEHVLSFEGVRLFEPEPAPEELLLKVHTHRYLEEVKGEWYFRGASLSVGGCVEAASRIAKGELTNALVFSVAAGHHAEPSYGWGGTYLSCIGPAAARLREEYGITRLAVIDTDSHHGNGTRAVFKGDPDVLHVCFCDDDRTEDGGSKIDVDVGGRTSDEAYLEKVRREFLVRTRSFKPFMIFHNFGIDTCQGDYGDRGLTRSFFPDLAREVKTCAEEVCEGRYLVITHGGFRIDTTEYVFPRIVEILAERTAVP